MKLLDQFTIFKPKMSYKGLVLEVMALNVYRVVQKAPQGKLSLEHGHLASRQIAMGLEYLHQCGVGHGGSSPNLCFSLLKYAD